MPRNKREQQGPGVDRPASTCCPNEQSGGTVPVARDESTNLTAASDHEPSKGNQSVLAPVFVEISRIKIPESGRSLDQNVVRSIVQSYRRFGVFSVVLLDEEYNLIFGRHRLDAYQEAGMATALCLIKSVAKAEAA